MKQKARTLLLLVIFLSACFYIRHHYGLGTAYNYFQAKSDLHNGIVQIVGYGLPLWSSKEAEIDSIQSVYGFKTVEFGCIVTPAELNGIEHYNQTVEDWLNKRNGKDWLRAYEKSVDSLNEIAFSRSNN
ncbi:hypothetical protein [Flavihumibacter sp. UBA7668]|uniref:FEKKY domain-containing protein n=1 Tax=Flavihumibacter sp. UBA7668 TaxID=1946542 RepID=UPI0025C1F28E|nr:hypothetical protein [Flavihumibacter sp. UBA7668]